MSISSRAALVACVLGWVVGAPATAHADTKEDVALNGTFTAFSNGQYARTNEQFHDEDSVTSIWTITTTCTTYQACSGRMSSDQGWTADVSYVAPMWYVVRTLDGWERCDDGSTAPGTQTFKFFQDLQFNPANLKGWDNTLNQSGSCGINKVLNIEMPFTLTPVG